MLIKIILTAILTCISVVSTAQEYIFKDEIKGGINQIHLQSGNAMIIIFVREKTAEFHFKNMIHISGIHISDPQALQWPAIKSNIFSIRFDQNLTKIVSNPQLLKESLSLWPPCLQEDCRKTGTPRIIENATGTVFNTKQPSGKYKHTLGLTSTPGEFEAFYSLYKGSKRMVIEVDHMQYIFNING